jgi:hypothetical protein
MFALFWFAVVAASSALTAWPAVLSDETNYLLPTLFGYRDANFARWGIVSQVPNHLFYAVYAALGHDDLYLKAKVLNATLVAGTALPIWLIARRHLPPWQAAAFSGVAIAMPLATFARYFMPESLYVFGFWWCAYAMLVRRTRTGLTAGIVAGVTLGLLSLVKPHALVLAVAVGVFFTLRGGRRGDRVLAVAGLALAFYATRVGVGSSFSGAVDFSLTGPAYGGVLAIGRFDPTALGVNAFGHVAALLLLAGFPVTALLSALATRPAPDTDGDLRDLILLAVCVLAALVAMTIWFSHGLYLSTPGTERVTRLHGRYYGFALTLAMLAFAALVHAGRVADKLRSPLALAGFGAVALAAYVVLVRDYEASIVDFPELGILPRWPNGLVVLAVAVVACAAAVVVRRRGAGWQFVLPFAWWAAVGVSTSALLLVAPLAGKWFAPDRVDEAMATDRLRELRGRDDGMIVGTPANAPDTYRVMFYVASRARGRIVAPGTTLSPEAVPADVRWLILLPEVSYAGPGESISTGPLQVVQLR